MDKLLGRFKFYKDNDLFNRTFATNTDHIVLNLLHPNCGVKIASALIEVPGLDLEACIQYDNKINRITDRHSKYFPSIKLQSLASIYENRDRWLNHDQSEDMPF